MEAFRDDRQVSLQIGTLLIREGYVTQEDVDEGLEIQKKESLSAPEKASRTIGEILCEQKKILPADLNFVLNKYDKQLKFGEILEKMNLVDEKTLREALYEQRHKDEPLGKILLDKEILTVDQLYMALSQQKNIPYARLDDFQIKESDKDLLVSIVGQKYAEKNHVLPLALEGDTLTLAVSDPDNLPITQELKVLYPKLEINSVIITQDKFLATYVNLYGKSLLRSQLLESKGEVPGVKKMIINIGQESAGMDDKSLIYGVSIMEAEELVNYIINYGITHNASDIHVEQDRDGPRLRIRVDGVLHTVNIDWLNQKLREIIGAVISRIKVISYLDIAERRIPQDGVCRVNYYSPEKKQEIDIDLRVATCPAIVGENVTIRILDPRKAKVGIDNLNHSEHVVDSLKRLLRSSSGMILVSGPTGSGKTTTLYAALQKIHNPSLKIITAEDPIEYSIPGIMQTQINPKIDLTYARLLRSFLRLDPDTILVGEIRDTETASIAFDAAQTGHLLLSTIHTNNSVSSIMRLLDLNIEHYQIASSLMGVMAQRLLRKICPYCRKKCRPPEDEWRFLFQEYPDHLTFYANEGCERCNYIGYKGRLLISELCVIDRDIIQAINKQLDEDEIMQVALKNGMKTMIDDGLSKLDQTTISEIIRLVPHEMIKEFKSRTSQ